jgi:dihydrofolate reductase
MIISAIVAASNNNAIGINNDMPWHLSEDLKFFKRTTMGKPILMGRKTFESLGCRPLPGRLNIILSAQDNLNLPEGVKQVRSLEEGIAMLKETESEEVFVIGGGYVFAEALPLTDRVYLTRVNVVVEDADVFFPELNPEEWILVKEEPHQADERNPYDYTFLQYDRVRN